MCSFNIDPDGKTRPISTTPVTAQTPLLVHGCVVVVFVVAIFLNVEPEEEEALLPVFHFPRLWE